MADVCIWEAMLKHEAYPRSWRVCTRAAPKLGYWKLLPGVGPIVAKGFKAAFAIAICGLWVSTHFCLCNSLHAQDCLLPDPRGCLSLNFTVVVEARVAFLQIDLPLQRNLADLLTEDSTGGGDQEYEERKRKVLGPNKQERQAIPLQGLGGW